MCEASKAGAWFGKIADAEFHARKIKWQPPISNSRDMFGIEPGPPPHLWKLKSLWP